MQECSPPIRPPTGEKYGYGSPIHPCLWFTDEAEAAAKFYTGIFKNSGVSWGLQRRLMKYLCLAYGDAKDWNALSKDARDSFLAQDEVLRQRGNLVASVEAATTVQAHNGMVAITNGPFAQPRVPLAGFSIIEAKDLSEVIELVSSTPCARAGGAVEIWPIR